MRETIHLVDLGIKFYREDYSFDNDLTATVSCSSVPSMNITPGTKVEIYWNLHKKVFSVRARSGEQRGRVIAHVNWFVLKNVSFVVNEAGRARVLQEKRKNVHAFVRGEWENDSNAIMSKVTYNPYVNTTFVKAIDGRPVRSAVTASGAVIDNHPYIICD
jgi:hypothetical protein